MQTRGLVLSLLLYLLLDFSNPMVPGAVTFNPEDCTDGIRASREAGSLHAQPSAPVPPRALTVPDTAQRVVAASRLTRMTGGPHMRLGQGRRAEAIATELSSPTEGH